MRKKLLFNCTKLFQKQACVSDNHELNDSSLISKNKHIVMKKLLLLFFMFMLANDGHGTKNTENYVSGGGS